MGKGGTFLLAVVVVVLLVILENKSDGAINNNRPVSFQEYPSVENKNEVVQKEKEIFRRNTHSSRRKMKGLASGGQSGRLVYNSKYNIDGNIPSSEDPPEDIPIPVPETPTTESMKPSPSTTPPPTGLKAPVTLLVTDSTTGKMAATLKITLSKLDESTDSFQSLTSSVTNGEGRVKELMWRNRWTKGTYRIRLDTKQYFNTKHQTTLFPYIDIVLNIDDPTMEYIVAVSMGNQAYTVSYTCTSK